ncbi:MAG: aminopeptidase P family protein [Spirochaetaceae bacterium]|nr:MAG: aminopeptidase P family protein [Spirochaetaceae bacterium]
MKEQEKIIQAIQAESFAGWLFYNLHHRDPVADRVCGISSEIPNTRPWVYLLRSSQDPVKIVHTIEAEILDHLPGRKVIYSGRESLAACLKEFAPGSGPWAADFSLSFPGISFIDHGTVLWLSDLGYKIVSSEKLIQQGLSTLTDEEIESHEEAGRILYQTVHTVWKRICSCFSGKKTPVYEGEVLGWILEHFEKNDMHTHPPLIVGAGIHSTMPHYYPEGKGSRLAANDVLQIDIWGKKKAEGAIYADISWVCFLGKKVPGEVAAAFAVIRDARDIAVDFIGSRFSAGESVTGADVDQRVEEFIRGAGYAQYLRHRTGHSIDTECHGYGVNIDSREYPDLRQLGPGACFSIEPGLYLSDFGVRTEIDVYIRGNKPVISGGKPQNEVLCFDT